MRNKTKSINCFAVLHTVIGRYWLIYWIIEFTKDVGKRYLEQDFMLNVLRFSLDA